MQPIGSLAALLAAVLLVGCGTTSRIRGRLDYLIRIRATQAQVVAEFGQPSKVETTSNGTVLTIVSPSKTTSRTVTRTVNGKAETETISTTVPGKLRMILTFVDDRLVSQTVERNQ